MLRRTEKLKRRRKSRNQKVLFLAMNSVSIVFLIFVAVSSRTGMTYGLFTARAEIDGGQIGICSVYPSQIEELLSQFVQHMNLAGADYLSIAGYSGSAGEGIADLDLAGASDEQLSQWISEINAKLGNTSNRQQSIDSLARSNTSAFESTQIELASAAAVLTQLSGYIGSVSVNCITPDESSLSEFLNAIQAGGAASESLKNQALAIHSALSGSQPELSAMGLSIDGSTISPAAIDFYQGAQQSLAGASNSIAQQSSTLQQQLAQVNDEIASREQAKAASEDAVEADEPAGDQIDKTESEPTPSDDNVQSPSQEEPAQSQDQQQDQQQQDQQQQDQQQDQPSDQVQEQALQQHPVLETN